MNQKTVLITGGGSGVGRATALALASEGYRVWVCGRRQEPLTETVRLVEQAGGQAFASTTDTSDPAQVSKLFQDLSAQFEHLDVLINGASVPANNIFNTEVADWAQILQVNLLGYAYCAREAVALMRTHQTQGQIINLGSLCVRVLDNGCDLYVAAKAGVAGFTASLRKELAGDSIAVTLLNPGQIASEMVSENEAQKAQKIAQFEMLDPADVAEAISFCLSRPARAVVTELELIPRAQSKL